MQLPACLRLYIVEHTSVTASRSFLDAVSYLLTLNTASQLGDARQSHRLRTLTWRASPIDIPSTHYLGACHTEFVPWERASINTL